MFASFDPVALDTACGDAVNRQRVMQNSLLAEREHTHGDHFTDLTPATNWRVCVEHAQAIGLGSMEYELVEVKIVSLGGGSFTGRRIFMYILEDILDTLSARMQDAPAPLITAVDGRCAAGKTTLAARLGEALGAPVFHMDDFYLPFARRTPQRLALPGGHMDSERLEAEILRPAAEGKEIIYRPYDAHADSRGAGNGLSLRKKSI